MMASINITALATTQPLLFESEDDMIFFQEHGTPSGKAMAIAAFAAEQGTLEDGPRPD